jgi:peptide/nickel transport system substrate-binding protein
VWNLVRNPHYWRDGFPRADKLTVRIVPDDTARIAGLRDGSIDVANFDSPDVVQLLEGQPNVETVVVPSTEFYRLDVNATTSILEDSRLREAVSLALDRKQIADVALAGTGEPTAAIAPSFGTCPVDSVPNTTPDVARAKELVEEAGANGKTIALLAVDINKPILQIAQVIEPQLEAIGLDVEIEQITEGQMFERVYTGKSDFDLTLAYFGSLADPPMGLSWWSKSQGWHTAWYPVDDELEALIDKSHAQQPGAARDATIKAACDRIARNANIIPLVTKPNVVAYRADKVTPDLPSTEAYFDPMRYLAGFSVNASR